MTYVLRLYQNEMASAMTKALTSDNPRPFIVQAATGAGKSLVIAEVCRRLQAPVLVLQPSLELLLQNHAKMEAYQIEASIYSASAGQKVIGDNVVMATIGSIYKKPELFRHFKYILVDECDVVNPKDLDGMYRKFFDAVGIRAIGGLTATPYRTVQKYSWKGGQLYASAALKVLTRIGSPTFWAGGIIYKIETQELIDQGYLVPIRYRSGTDDFHDLVVNTTGADFTEASLEHWASRKTKEIADYCLYAAPHARRTLVFCTSVHQAHSLRELLASQLITAAVVTAETPAKERQQAVAAFKDGEIKFMLNVGVFLAGFDVPELDCIIFARPTMSLRVWYQAVGRGVRLDADNPDKMLRVFDLGGALGRMGKVEAIRLGKEPGGFKDAVFGEQGRADEKPLFNWRIQRKAGDYARRR